MPTLPTKAIAIIDPNSGEALNVKRPTEATTSAVAIIDPNLGEALNVKRPTEAKTSAVPIMDPNSGEAPNVMRPTEAKTSAVPIIDPSSGKALSVMPIKSAATPAVAQPEAPSKLPSIGAPTLTPAATQPVLPAASSGMLAKADGPITPLAPSTTEPMVTEDPKPGEAKTAPAERAAVAKAAPAILDAAAPAAAAPAVAATARAVDYSGSVFTAKYGVPTLEGLAPPRIIAGSAGRVGSALIASAMPAPHSASSEVTATNTGSVTSSEYAVPTAEALIPPETIASESAVSEIDTSAASAAAALPAVSAAGIALPMSASELASPMAKTGTSDVHPASSSGRDPFECLPSDSGGEIHVLHAKFGKHQVPDAFLSIAEGGRAAKELSQPVPKLPVPAPNLEKLIVMHGRVAKEFSQPASNLPAPQQFEKLRAVKSQTGQRGNRATQYSPSQTASTTWSRALLLLALIFIGCFGKALFHTV